MTGEDNPRVVRAFRVVMIGALVIVAARAIFAQGSLIDALAISDNDDIIRFLSVRDLLHGQNWFDMTQYRILPPEGMPLHWSRYIDAGIAGLIRLAALFVPMENAETFAIAAWPALLLAAFVLLVGTQTRALLGPGIAAVAIIMVVVWPVTSLFYFRTARLDHHGMQILLAAATVLFLLRRETPVRFGIFAGLAAACSLAVGLEALPVIGLAGLLQYLRTLRDPDAEGGRLLAFATTLVAAGLVLFVGQTAPGEWLVPRCDELSPSPLALTLVALAASGTLVCAAKRVRPVAAFAASAVVLGLGAALAAPLLLPCLDGPYADMSPEVRDTVLPVIQEVRPALYFLANDPGVFFSNMAPAIGSVLVAALVWAYRRQSGQSGPDENRVIGTLLVLGAAFTAATFAQGRFVVLTAGTVPVLAGYGIAPLLALRLTRPNTANAVAFVAACCVSMLPGLLFQGYQKLRPVIDGKAGRPEDTSSCRTPEAIRTLDTLPPGRVLGYINLGAPLLLLTHHTALAAPYHRRAEVMGNGILPFAKDEAGFRGEVKRLDADYVVLCRNAQYVDSRETFAESLAAGVAADGFVPITEGVDPDFVVLKVEKP